MRGSGNIVTTKTTSIKSDGTLRDPNLGSGMVNVDFSIRCANCNMDIDSWAEHSQTEGHKRNCPPKRGNNGRTRSG